MNSSNPRSVEAKITRLTREIEEIDQFFYKGNENEDRDLYAGMLERKRDDMVRSTVLQMHTAIEDVLNSQMGCGSPRQCSILCCGALPCGAKRVRF